MPVSAPLDSTSRRGRPCTGAVPGAAPPSVPGADRRPAIQVSRAGAPAAPASTSGVQAKKNTMSEPVKYGDEWKLTVRNSVQTIIAQFTVPT